MIENTPRPETEPRKQMKVRPPLILYDVLIFVLTDLLLLVLYRGGKSPSLAGVVQQSVAAFVCIFGSRYLGISDNATHSSVSDIRWMCSRSTRAKGFSEIFPTLPSFALGPNSRDSTWPI